MKKSSWRDLVMSVGVAAAGGIVAAVVWWCLGLNA